MTMQPYGTTMKTVHSFDEIPAFKNEAEEAAFWTTHELGDELLERMGPRSEDVLPPPRQRTVPVSLRFDEWTIKRAKRIARRRNMGYQTLIKQFVAERLYEEEKREGLISSPS